MKKKALCSKVMAVVMAASLMVIPAEAASAGEFQDENPAAEAYMEEDGLFDQGGVSEESEAGQETAEPEANNEGAASDNIAGDVFSDAEAANGEDAAQDGGTDEITLEQEEDSEELSEEPSGDPDEEMADDFSAGESENAKKVPEGIASQTDGKFTWYVIEDEDCFYIEGSGSFDAANPPWGDITKRKCKKVVVDIKGMTDLSGMFQNMKNVETIDFKTSDFSKVTNMKNMFSGCENLKQIKSGRNWDTSKITDMSGMFSGCSSLTELNLSAWDTSCVRDMNGMFSECGSLAEVNLGTWNTSCVTDMSNMFSKCENLSSMNVSGWDVSNVINMEGMFCACSSLGSLDLSKWNTSKVTDMKEMFSGCWLTSLNVSGWKTSSVTTMEKMFAGNDFAEIGVSGWDVSNVENMSDMFWCCGTLEKLDLSRWNTAKVTSMYEMFWKCVNLKILDISGSVNSNLKNVSSMFNECHNLQSLNLSNFKTSNVTNMSSMFWNCRSLQTIGVSGFDTSNVTNMSNMFQGCSGVKTLDVSKFNTSAVTNMGAMFSGCSSLQALDVSGFDTSKVTNMGSMFSGCNKVQKLDVSGFNTSNVTNMGSMMMGCDSISSLDVSKFDTSNVTDMRYMFHCKNLQTLDLSGFNTSKVENMSGMFNYCENLKSLDISSFKTSNVTDMSGMFSSCKNLQALDVSGFDTANVTTMYNMFSECISLQKLDVSRFNTAQVTNMSGMFSNISCLGALNLKSFNTCEVTDMSFMFYCADGGETLDLSSFNTSNVNSMKYMFYGTKLKTFKPAFDMLRVSDASRMFQRTFIENLDLSGISHVKEYIDTTEMFNENHIQILKTIPGLKVNKAIAVDTMYDDAGNTYTELPQERISITLKKKTATPTPEPTATPKPTVKPTAIPTATPKPTVKPTAIPTATPKPTAKPTATPKPIAKPTATPTEKPTTTPNPTATPVPVRTSIKKAVVTVSSCTYNGKAQSPAVKVVLGKTVLKKNVDYTLKYVNNKNTGTKATVTVTGKGKYKDSITKKFTIRAYIFNSKVTASIKSVIWNGKTQKPAITLKWNGKILKNGTDYTAVYKNNKEPGKATVTITGKGNFTGKKTAFFTINKAKQPVKVSPASLKKTIKEKGKSYAIKITGRKESAKVTYSSANKKVVSISKGKMVVKGRGNTTVTVKLAATKHYNAATIKIPVQISAVTKKSQVITTTIKDGGVIYYRSTPISLGAKLSTGNGKLTFSSDDMGGVKVDAKGNLIMGKDPDYYGDTWITITASETAEYKKTVKKIMLTTAEKIPSGSLAERIKAEMEKFPEGKYWNHEVVSEKDLASFLDNGSYGGEYGDEKDKERFANTVSSVPCSDHKGEPVPGQGQYDCNYFDYTAGGNIFGDKLFYDIWGVKATNVKELDFKYGSQKNQVEVGDLVTTVLDVNGIYIQPNVLVTGVDKKNQIITGMWCDFETENCKIIYGEIKFDSIFDRYHVDAY